MTPITDWIPGFCEPIVLARFPMNRRHIAGMLILTLLAWASSSGFPQLRPPSHAGHEPTHQNLVDHSGCCPSKFLNAALLLPAMPCGSQHRCCILHGPDSPSSLPVSSEKSRPGDKVSAEVVQSAPIQTASCPAKASSLELAKARPYFAFSMILRI